MQNNQPDHSISNLLAHLAEAYNRWHCTKDDQEGWKERHRAVQLALGAFLEWAYSKDIPDEHLQLIVGLASDLEDLNSGKQPKLMTRALRQKLGRPPLTTGRAARLAIICAAVAILSRNQPQKLIGDIEKEVARTAMMAAEIVGGVWFGSVALIADGLHMSTHAGGTTQGGKTVGPLDLKEMQIILSKISDPRNLQVWKVGFKGWERAGDVPELAEFIHEPPPLPQEPPRLPPRTHRTSQGIWRSAAAISVCVAVAGAHSGPYTAFAALLIAVPLDWATRRRRQFVQRLRRTSSIG